MLAEIITIGDEILIGQIVDTNATYIAQELTKIGVKVHQITSIQDEKQHILKALEEAKSRVQLVILTGGLGPTKDDITKQTFCEYFNDTLVQNKEVLIHIKKLYKKYTSNTLISTSLDQALLPSKAIILHNDFGTASGMWLEKVHTVFISLPGVPYEMKHLMKEKVIPLLIKKFDRPFIYHKTLLTYGMGESEIAHRIFDWEENLPKTIALAYLPSLGSVRLRLSSSGKNQKEVKKVVDHQMNLLQKLLKEIVIGFEGETSIIKKIASKLVSDKQSLSIAESCTGGAIAEKFTSKAGASNYFKGSIVPYKTSMKTTILGVDEDLIKKHTVVSKQVVEAMAFQSCKIFETDYAIATTGVAGPSSGDTNDEIGTVFVAIASPQGVYSEKFQFGKPRERVIVKATNKALELFYKEISKK